jgi:hypothetical protein
MTAATRMSASDSTPKSQPSWQLRLFDTVWQGVVAGKSQWNPEKSCYDLAREYHLSGRAVAECVQTFIDWQAAKAGAGGFVLGLPGIMASAVSIPADLTMTTYIQLRMVAVIALLRGWDIQAPGLQTAALLCLMGSGAADFIEKLGLPARAGSVPLMLAGLPPPLLHKINGLVASRLVVSAGKSSALGMVKFVPLVGGLVNGGLDGLATRGIGKQADLLFRPAAAAPPPPPPPERPA